jgi:hypothetical protein
LLAVVETRLAAWVMGARAVDDMLCVCCRFDRDDVVLSGHDCCTAVMISMLVEISQTKRPYVHDIDGNEEDTRSSEVMFVLLCGC